MSKAPFSAATRSWHDRAALASVAAVTLTLLVLGWGVASYKVALIGDIRYVGHADEAAYAEMGRSLVAGRGFRVRHVSVFFIPYDRQIERREDHWPPLMGMAIAPCLAIFGHEAWAAKLPAIVFASIGLPLAAAGLGLALSRRAYVALLAGLCMLADVTIFTESLKTLSDVTLAMLATAWLACVIGARSCRWLHVVAGVVAAAAFYTKGSHIILLGLWPAASLLVEGWRVFARRWIYLGGGAAVALLSPWLIANAIDYGRPLHSTQNYVSGFIAVDNWEQRFYRPHWGRDLPTLSDRWTKDPQRYWKLVERQRESMTRWGLLGPRAEASQWRDMGTLGMMVGDWLAPTEPPPRWRRRAEPREPGWRPGEWRDPVASWCGILGAATVAGAAIAAAAHGTWWCVQRARRRPRITAAAHAVDPMLVGPVAAIALTAAAQWAFVVYLWEAMPRLALVMLPTMAVLAATGASRAIESPWRWVPRWGSSLQRWHWAAAPPLCVLAVALAWWHAPALKDYHVAEANLHGSPYVEQPFYPDLGDWLGRHAPDAVVMCRRPWQLRFASPDTLRGVGLPYAEPGIILWIARYYGVTHYLDDEPRPGMYRYLHGRHPAFVRLADAAPASGKLYRIDWDQLDPAVLKPPHDGATLD